MPRIRGRTRRNAAAPIIASSSTTNTGTVRFKQTQASYSEAVGSTKVGSVERVGGTDGPGHITIYYDGGGTAVEATDFNFATAQIVTWVSGNADDKHASAGLINRDGQQGSRSFTISLRSASGVTLGSPSQMTIFIADAGSAGSSTSADPASAQIFYVDGDSGTSGVGTSADPFNSFQRINNVAAPISAHTIFNIRGTFNETLSPNSGTSAAAQVVIRLWGSANASIEGTGAGALEWGVDIENEVWITIQDGSGAQGEFVVDGGITTAERAAAATSAGGWAALQSLAHITKACRVSASQNIVFRGVKFRDTAGYYNIQVRGNCDGLQFLSCEARHMGIPGQTNPTINDEGDGFSMVATGTSRWLIKNCLIGPIGHTALDALGGRGLAIGNIINSDWSGVAGGNRGSRCMNISRSASFTLAEKNIFINNGSSDESAIESVKLEGENGTFRFNLMAPQKGRQFIKSQAASFSHAADQGRIVHNTMHGNVYQYGGELEPQSGYRAFGRWQWFNNALGSVGASGSNFIRISHNNGSTFREWNQNFIFRGNIYPPKNILIQSSAGSPAGNPGSKSVDWYESNHASIVSNNYKATSPFPSPSIPTSQIYTTAWASASASFAVTTGTPSPLTTGNAQGVSVSVGDARFWRGQRGFSLSVDPFWISGYGSAAVLTVNYATDVLTLDTSVNMTNTSIYYFDPATSRAGAFN